MRALATAAAVLLLAAPLAAQDFSADSEARSWNLYAEVPALFDARVVDVMCELTGDCPANCGDGARQLGLLRSADDALVLATKNNQSAFSGAVVDLLPYCGQDVTVDGLLIEDPDLGASNIYLVQRVKTAGGDWAKTDRFTGHWAEQNPDVAGDGPWFRRDPRIAAEIEKNGYLGLGLETDEAFKSYLFK
ncbi:hypothetical protein BOO69_04215 [Sulfitobacter alexandrii]|uniref:Uncharacterized protein n=1 Tax=Sulfitobacter alexandrii TaxID=1917485 RepID=A0A1J0WEH2_9RHOB|nr:hypothetical protein [Sulfitobacter alexandrii]APE42717.1 hypothetical protein BOO69_04215 [Sulfitobacter alexandrii]